MSIKYPKEDETFWNLIDELDLFDDYFDKYIEDYWIDQSINLLIIKFREKNEKFWNLLDYYYDKYNVEYYNESIFVAHMLQ